MMRGNIERFPDAARYETVAVAHYSGVHDFIEDIRDPSIPFTNPGNRRSYDRHMQDHEREWYGLTAAEGRLGFRGILKLGEHGWERGIATMSEFMDDLQVPRLPDVRRRRKWSDDGDSVDISRVYAGRLDTAWQRTVRHGANSPRAFIAVDFMASAGISGDAMFWKGAAAGCLALRMVEAGYTVSLVSACKHADYGYRNTIYSVCVKPYTGPLTVSDAAFACALPAFFRKLGFLWADKFFSGSTGSTAGHCAYLDNEDLPTLDSGNARYRFLAPATGEIYGKGSARRWTDRCIEELMGRNQ